MVTVTFQLHCGQLLLDPQVWVKGGAQAWDDGGAPLWIEGGAGVLFPLVGSGSNILEYGGVIETQTFLGKVDIPACAESWRSVCGGSQVESLYSADIPTPS